MSLNEIIFASVFLLLGFILGFYIGYNRKSSALKKEGNAVEDAVIFDHYDYGDDYFHDPKNREETRKILLEHSLQKINQHIVYFLTSIAPIVTIINLKNFNLIRVWILMNSFIVLIYMVIRLFYWSSYHDYSMTVAPRIPENISFFHQDSLMLRYHSAVNYRMEHPDSNRRRIAKVMRKINFIRFVLTIIVLNIIYFILVYFDKIPFFTISI